MSAQPASPAATAPLAATPPRLLLALALVGAAALSLGAAVLAMVAVGTGDLAFGAELGLLRRIQYGTRLLDNGTLLLVPLAVLLARLVEPHAGAPASPVVRSVLLGSSAVGAAATFLIVLRLVADLGGGDLLVAGVGAALLVDVGQLLVAAAGTLWSLRELQRTPPVGDPGPRPPAPSPSAFGPGPAGAPPGTMPPGTTPPGFPAGPPPPPPMATEETPR